MKIIYLFRDTYDAKYILYHLDKKKLVEDIILEKGVKAKKKKLKKILFGQNFLYLPLKVIDILTLILYSSYMTSEMKKKLGPYKYPTNKVKLVIDDANDDTCINYILRSKPDLIFIYGTAILKKRFFSKIKCRILNIHTGILPKYRNVHSDFWAFIRDDKNNIGVSVIEVAQRVDSGGIILQKKAMISKNDSLSTAKVKNLKLVVAVVKDVVQRIKSNDLKTTKQKESKASFYPTPNVVQIIKNLPKIL